MIKPHKHKLKFLGHTPPARHYYEYGSPLSNLSKYMFADVNYWFECTVDDCPFYVSLMPWKYEELFRDNHARLC